MLFGLLHDYVAMGNIASMSTLLHKIHETPAKCILRHFAALPHSYCVFLYLGGTYLLPPSYLHASKA